MGAPLSLDPTRLSAMDVVDLAIGMATRALGTSVLVASAIFRVPLKTMTETMWPKLLAMFFVHVFVTYVPWVTPAIPGAFG